MQEYFKRVAQHANEIFLEVPDLKGLIIAGPGPTKEDFERGGFLHYTLRDKVIATLDTAYTGEQGVEEVVHKAPEVLRKVRYIEEKRIIQQFLYEIGHDTGLATYGEEEVRSLLNMGAVKLLLLSEALDAVRVKIECTSCEYSEYKTLKKRDLEKFKVEIGVVRM